jgi:anti-sigma regulatory factor (Ser/Thr protein kinase)
MSMPATSGRAVLRTARTYPGTPDQIRVVRVDIRALADGCPLVEDIVLCGSELATNAVMHSHSGMPGGTCAVRIEIHPGSYAWVEVEDAGGPWNRPEPDPNRGHGLDIVAKLASDWGIAGDYRGRTIWARFDWPSRTTGAASEPAATATGAARPPMVRMIGARPLAPWTTILDGRRLREMRRRHGLPRNNSLHGRRSAPPRSSGLNGMRALLAAHGPWPALRPPSASTTPPSGPPVSASNPAR